MAKTYSFNCDAPANSAAPSGGAAAIRLLKDAIHERHDLDHYWEKSGETADVDDIGYHRKSTLLVQATAPTAKANAGIIYSKDVSDKAELFYRDEDDNEVQLTSGGAINVAASFISGDLLLTKNTGAKSGWTDRTATYAGKYLRIGATALATGGSATHTHAKGTLAAPIHTHNVSHLSWGAGGGTDGGGTLATKSANVYGATAAKASGGASSTTITGSTATGANTPVYVDTRLYEKD